jgi:hypothetical protein
VVAWDEFLREYFSQEEYASFNLSLDEMIVCYLASAFENKASVRFGRKGFDLIAYEVAVSPSDYLAIPIEELEGRGFDLLPWETPEEYLTRHWNIF